MIRLIAVTSILIFFLFCSEHNLISISPEMHFETPAMVKGIYVTSSSAIGRSFPRLLSLVERTELNTMVIDINNNEGPILFNDADATINFIKKLHSKNIYVIARFVTFKNERYARCHPQFALKWSSGRLWTDSGKSYWLDPAAKPYWQFVAQKSVEAFNLGFDEINYDYIRFPSDGNVGAARYPYWDKKVSRQSVMKDFFQYLKENVRDKNNIPISIDVFGYVFLRDNDQSIGQYLRDIVHYFDYVMPMPYPSHYGRGNFGFSNPAAHPYEVIYKTITAGWNRVKNDQKNIAKARSWIQDFNMGAVYDARMVRLEIQAIYDAGGVGWILWNAGNIYTEGALNKK